MEVFVNNIWVCTSGGVGGVAVFTEMANLK